MKTAVKINPENVLAEIKGIISKRYELQAEFNPLADNQRLIDIGLNTIDIAEISFELEASFEIDSMNPPEPDWIDENDPNITPISMAEAFVMAFENKI